MFVRGDRTWAIAIQRVLSEPKFRTEFLLFSREKRPEFRRRRDLCEPLLTAMAQVLPSLSLGLCKCGFVLLLKRLFRDMSAWRWFEPCFKGIWACDPLMSYEWTRRNAANRHLEIPGSLLICSLLGISPAIYISQKPETPEKSQESLPRGVWDPPTPTPQSSEKSLKSPKNG